MTAHLPPSLLALFAPRPPIPYMPPVETRKCPAYTGVSTYLQFFDDPATTTAKPSESLHQTKERKKREKEEKSKKELEAQLAEWDPYKDPKATSDPNKTLFIGRISFNSSEHKLKREFEAFGPVKKLRLIVDKKGKPRGYGFVEFERERDMREALRKADGRKIDGRRVVVDFERGRTSRSWKPRRLGGGLGGTRIGGDDVNQRFSGRQPPSKSRERRSSSYGAGGRSREGDTRKRERSRDREPREREKKRHRERSRERR